jgi:capsular exopolysaccharide synthesis family protein
MSRVDAAFQRAILDGVVQPTGTEPVATVVQEPTEFPREAAARRAVPENDHRGLFGTQVLDEPLSYEGKLKLPPTALSQLVNLVHTLELDPARPRTIAFVSSGRGEGTTTCCANLGAFLATRRAKVLMVDANLHHPTLHSLAGVTQPAGLAELAASRLDVDGAIKPTVVPNLFLITSGETPHSGHNGLLMASVLRHQILSRSLEYDFTLVDCPPVNMYEEAAALAACCDAVILVVEGGRTLRHTAQASKALLERAQCRILGVFMNKRKFYVPQFLYDRL